MYRLFSLLIMLVMISACSSNTSEGYPIIYQKSKPNVAFIPVIEEAECAYNWDLSKELTDATLTGLMDKNTTCITPFVQFKPALDFTKGADYFGSDLNFANYFGQSDFLVISQLEQHEVVPYEKSKFPDIEPRRGYGQFQVLVLGMRVRVIDLRYENPKVVLQKFIETHEIVSNSEKQINYEQVVPKHELWNNTPLCRGHDKLAKELANEIEGSLLCNW